MAVKLPQQQQPTHQKVRIQLEEGARRRRDDGRHAHKGGPPTQFLVALRSTDMGAWKLGVEIFAVFCIAASLTHHSGKEGPPLPSSFHRTYSYSFVRMGMCPRPTSHAANFSPHELMVALDAPNFPLRENLPMWQKRKVSAFNIGIARWGKFAL